MISGTVRDNEALIRFFVIGPAGRKEIAAVVDTGFTAELSLPPSIITDLNLPWIKFDRAILADGEESLFDVYEAHVEWDGTVRGVNVHLADSEPLVGMELLHGHELNIKVKRGGKVTIKRLTPR